jgi:hypothetical protein
MLMLFNSALGQGDHVELTNDAVERFVGGQAEFQDPSMYLLRGEVGAIAVEDDNGKAILRVCLNWIAKGEGWPPTPNRWVWFDHGDHQAVVHLTAFTATDIGPSPEGGGNRILLASSESRETVKLFPPDGSKLEPAKVEGFDVKVAADYRIRWGALDLLHRDRELDDSNFTPPGARL